MAKLTGPGGTVDVAVGDRFTDRSEGIEWQIAAFTNGRIYSPSGFGGTPIVKCIPLRSLDDLPPFLKQYIEEDGTVEWCGDSIATLIIAGRAALETDNG